MKGATLLRCYGAGNARLITAEQIFGALLAATFLRADKRLPPAETPGSEAAG
jgi:hypothetical protein